MVVQPATVLADGTCQPPQFNQEFYQDLDHKYGPVVIEQGVVMAKNANTLRVLLNGKDYMVNIGQDTPIYRRYFGIGTMNQINYLDHVNIRGTVQNLNVSATMVHDTDIQEACDTMRGSVVSINPFSRTVGVQTEDRGTVYATLDDRTWIEDHNGIQLPFKRITMGDRVELDGIYDHGTQDVHQVDWFQDFSQYQP